VEGITVVNLDCLVNNAAYDALRAGRYPEYVVRTVDVFIQPIGRTRMFLDRSQYEHLLHLLGRDE